jgi:hypothetical protein
MKGLVEAGFSGVLWARLAGNGRWGQRRGKTSQIWARRAAHWMQYPEEEELYNL